MDKELIDKFTTDNYRILKILYDNKVKMTDGSVFTPLTQGEVANQMGISKITINVMFRDLQKYGLIYPYQSGRGRYCLTGKALIVIKQIEALENKLKKIEN